MVATPFKIHELATELRQKNQRLGQAYFNAAQVLDFEWAEKIKGTDLDPFYERNGAGDSILIKFMDKWHEDHPESHKHRLH